MQTFITDHNVSIAAKNLDNTRLGKQRVEALQIFECLEVPESKSYQNKSMRNHKAVQMWEGYSKFLIEVYVAEILYQWQEVRGFNNSKCFTKYMKYRNIVGEYPIIRPHWITDEFIEAHRSNLIAKYPGFYRPLFPNTKDGLEYIWPKG
jgi:hypothetical protein